MSSRSKSALIRESEKIYMKKYMEKIEVGKAYGNIHVDRIADKSYRAYDCTCLKCGREFTADGHTVYEYANTGCGDCRKKAKYEKRVEPYVGKTFGFLKVLEFSGTKPTYKDTKHYSIIVSCLCLKCGEVTEIPLKRIKSGGAKQCSQCARKEILPIGYELVQASNVKGTSVLQITNRAINKNNQSGHKGVSWRKKSNKWFAYINFQRKQYYLGQYDDLQDAVNARLAAEKKIYGSFLEWYATEYPEQWERLKKRNEKT